MVYRVSYLSIAGSSCLLASAIVLTKNIHGRFTFDSHGGIQKCHVAPTPRVGGLAVMLALIVGAYMLTPKAQSVLVPILFASLPAFLMGVAEDITKKVGVGLRFWATLFSGVLAWLLTDISLNHVQIGFVDVALKWAPLSVILTALAVGGIANAINMIDGFNGLAGGALVMMFSAIGAVAFQADDRVLAGVCWIFAVAYAGFLVVNFPAGKIFLGDGGAYLGGFALAWVAILLPERNAQVSPWASLLICAYPVMELLFSIARRRHRQLHPGAADRLHLHSLVHMRVVRHFVGGRHPTIRNAAVSPFMWLFAVVPGAVAQFGWESRAQCLAAFVLTFAAYLLCYLRLVRFRWFWRPAAVASGERALDQV